ncbi:hypothetical protein HPB50_002136 [Hyalomma asiaticum]|uniref:Uncharacterized protein n=1 Tax=Hyalomma asiaticum TaxID=266040 RepID=A0ACB7RSN2_HYAAI|nr:hypothetical protein HPB50_002136 [Hyalomma asiaticum]
MREADYDPRTVPRKVNGMGPPKKNGMGPRQPAELLTSAKAHRAKALQIRHSAMASVPAVQASDDGQKNGKNQRSPGRWTPAPPKREENEFLVRQKEIELQHRRLGQEERRMELEERKVALDEE